MDSPATDGKREPTLAERRAAARRQKILANQEDRMKKVLGVYSQSSEGKSLLVLPDNRLKDNNSDTTNILEDQTKDTGNECLSRLHLPDTNTTAPVADLIDQGLNSSVSQAVTTTKHSFISLAGLIRFSVIVSASVMSVFWKQNIFLSFFTTIPLILWFHLGKRQQSSSPTPPSVSQTIVSMLTSKLTSSLDSARLHNPSSTGILKDILSGKGRELMSFLAGEFLTFIFLTVSTFVVTLLIGFDVSTA